MRQHIIWGPFEAWWSMPDVKFVAYTTKHRDWSLILYKGDVPHQPEPWRVTWGPFGFLRNKFITVAGVQLPFRRLLCAQSLRRNQDITL